MDESAGTALLLTVAPDIEHSTMPIQIIQTSFGKRGTGPFSSIATTKPKVPAVTSFLGFLRLVGMHLITKLVTVNDTGPNAKIVPISQSG